MKRTLICLLYLIAVYLAPRAVYSQTRADTAHLRDAVAVLIKARDASNNSRGVKTMMDGQIRAESTYFRSKAPAPVDQPPVAAFTVTHNDSTRLVRVANSSTDPEGGALTYRTLWGDGAVSTAVSPSHTYATWGAKTVTLIATDAGGRADTVSRTVTLVQPAPVVNAAPVASFSKSYDPTTRTVAVNAGASRDDKAITRYDWSFGDGTAVVQATTPATTHKYIPDGTFTISLTVRDAEGLTNATTLQQSVTAPVDTVIAEDSTTTDTTASIAALAELPRGVPVLVVPAATRVTTVTATGSLQTAINLARGGDEIRLTGTHGPIILPSRPCDGTWVTIRSNAADSLLPRPGERVAPKHAPYLPRIVSPDGAPAIKTVNPTCGWRLFALDITGTLPITSINYGLVWLGDGGWVGGGENQVSLAQVPRNLIIDRVWLHGSATLNSTRCLFLNSGATQIINSYLSDCHAKGFDSQAILGCNGPGPYLIENNYLEGAGENVMFGGCDPVVPELIPSDITIRRNHFFKPPAWKTAGWSIKNLFELKNARRVLLEGNVLENSWPSGQAGMAIVIKSSTENCVPCTWVGTKDVTIRYNDIRRAHRGLNIQAIDASSAGLNATHTERITVHDNRFTDIGTVNGIAPTDGWLMLLTQDLKDITIQRNTFVSNTPGYGFVAYMAYPSGGARLDIRGNLFAGQSYYALAADGGKAHAAALTAFAGSAWRFSNNVVAQVDGQFQGLMPAGNVYVDAVSKLSLTSQFTSTLYPTAGANIPEIQRRTAGVVVP